MLFSNTSKVWLLNPDVITVVSGLPRSGTSLMMRMLRAGGLSVLTDKVREADTDNPDGYFEFERVKKLPGDTDWLPEAKGKAVKVLAELIKHLPPGYHYRIVFMMRNLEEILASQKKMLIRRGEDPDKVSDAELMDLYRSYLKNLKLHVNSRENIEVHYVSYNELMDRPEEEVGELNGFFQGGLDADKMLRAIDPELYRNRA